MIQVHRTSTSTGSARCGARSRPLSPSCGPRPCRRAGCVHAVVQPAASRPAEQQVYTLTVPNERDSDVVSVALQVPPDIDSLLVERSPGGGAAPARGRPGRGRPLVGGRIAGDQYDTFRFIARNPVQAGELEWKVIQRYTDATDRWIGPADTEQPAARTTITEQAHARGRDKHRRRQQTSRRSRPARTTPAADSGGMGDGDSNTVPIVLGVVALMAALAALGIALHHAATLPDDEARTRALVVGFMLALLTPGAAGGARRERQVPLPVQGDPAAVPGIRGRRPEL